MNLFDNEFDPLAQLEACQHNITELIKAYQHQSEILKEVLIQHGQLNELLRTTRLELHRQGMDLEMIKVRLEQPKTLPNLS